jgi:DNA-binding transcriptional LysR family regulator
VAGKTGVGALEETEMCSEELALIGPAAFNGKAALKKSGAVRVLVFRTGCSYRRYLESFLVDLGINQIRAIELGTLEGILGCVSAGLGITLLPKAVVEQSPYKNNLSVHGIASPHSIVPTFFIRRANSYTNLALKHFMETAAAQLKNGTRRAAKNGIARSGLNLMITEAPA